MYFNKKTGFCKNKRYNRSKKRIIHTNESPSNLSEQNERIYPLIDYKTSPNRFVDSPYPKNQSIQNNITILKSTTPISDQFLSRSISIHNTFEELGTNNSLLDTIKSYSPEN